MSHPGTEPAAPKEGGKNTTQKNETRVTNSVWARCGGGHGKEGPQKGKVGIHTRMQVKTRGGRKQIRDGKPILQDDEDHLIALRGNEECNVCKKTRGKERRGKGETSKEKTGGVWEAYPETVGMQKKKRNKTSEPAEREKGPTQKKKENEGTIRNSWSLERKYVSLNALEGVGKSPGRGGRCNGIKTLTTRMDVSTRNIYVRGGFWKKSAKKPT